VRFDERRRRLFWDGGPMDGKALAALLLHLGDPSDVAAVTGLAERTRHHVRQMALDKLTHGFVDLEDPTWVGYDYELVAASVWKRAPRAGQGQRAFFIGGGPYTFQRRLLALDPRAHLVTSEIDPAVTSMAMARMGLVPHPGHLVAHEDARLALPRVGNTPEERFDVVFGDAFNDFSVPYHLTTLEFAREVRARLTPGGMYLVNVVDAWDSGLFLGAFHATLGEVFAHTAILSLGPRSDATRETFVLVAGDAPLPLDGLLDDLGRPLDVVRYGEADLAALRARSGGLVLTDDFAPVEALLAPVARSAGS
jgi:spermidine synthase